MTATNADVKQVETKVEVVADEATKPLPSEKPVPEVTIKPGTSFDDALFSFRQSNVAAKAWGRYCAELALEHFIVHGDTILLRRFYAAMVKDWNRKAAFLLWAKEFSPLHVKGSGADIVLSKDKSPFAMPNNLEGAKAIAFWEFAPERIEEALNEGMVFKLLFKQLDKMENKESDENTKRLLARLRTTLTRQFGNETVH